MLATPPEGNFDISDSVPEIGQDVEFDATGVSDADGGTPTILWDFGDGGSGSGDPVSHSYASAGQQTVTMTLVDPEGVPGEDRVVSHTLRVNAPPNAVVNCSPASVALNQATSCNGSSSTDAEGGVSYAWDVDGDGFDDGTDPSENFSFSSGGTKTIRLRVTDGDSATDIAQQNVTVQNSAPTARFDFSPANPSTGQQVSFDGSASTDPDNDTLTYAWDVDGDGFDDGNGQTKNHTFTSGGNKSVRLRVSDPGGLQNIATEIVPVGNAAPTARITFSPSNPTGSTAITFDGSTSSDPEGAISGYAWDIDNDGQFDDGNGATKVHTFNSGGSKTVRLQVTDSDNVTDTEQVTVTIGNSAPTARFTFSPANPAVGQQISFNGTTSSDPEGNALSYAWDVDGDGFDDGTASTLNHSFTSGGNKSVRLRVTDPGGLQHIETEIVPVANALPTARITFSPSNPTGSTAITFDGSTSSDPEGAISGYAWDIDNDGQFDDGNGATKVHTFNSGGTKTVRLRVTDSDNATNVTQVNVTIANSAPTARFTFSPASPSVGQQVSFNASTSTDPEGDALTYAWDVDGDGFDDGTGATKTHTFNSGPNHTVRVQATDTGGLQNVASQIVPVGNTAPTARFTFAGTKRDANNQLITPLVPDAGEAVDFVSTSTDPDGTGDIDRVEWDLDYVGTTFTVDRVGASIQHSFPTAGAKRVALRVTDRSGAQSNPVAVTGAGGISALRVNALPNVGGISILNQQRETGQRRTVPLAGQPFAYTARALPAIPGESPAPGCQPGAPSPEALGSTDPDNASDGNATEISLYQWDLDYDGVTFNVDATGLDVPSPPAGFPAGTRRVGLRVTDTDGATATTAPISFRINAAPTAQFVLEPLTPIVGQEITFTNNSQDPDADDHSGALTYSWDLDNDGQFCEQGEIGPNVKKMFPTANTNPGHRIRLRVTDTGGITREIERFVKVQNTIPTGAFTWSPISPLPGQTVTFDGGPSTATAGKSITSYEWDFDFDPTKDQFDVDATGASVPRSFPTSGSKTIGLRVTETDGGFGIVYDTIVVNAPPRANFSMSDESPFAGDPVTVSSTSADPDGPLATQQWDLDNDGQFDDANGPVVFATFARPGLYTLRLRVTDAKGATSTAFKEVTVRQRPVPPPELLQGVVIEIKGSIFGRLTQLKRLLVKAPAGAKVTIRCRGKACPKSFKKARSKRIGKRKLRFKKLERKLPPRTKIIVQVTMPGFIGRQTTFTMLRGQAPKRVDLCLPPGAKRATTCPAS